MTKSYDFNKYLDEVDEIDLSDELIGHKKI